MIKKYLVYLVLGLFFFAGCGKDAGVEKDGEGGDEPTSEKIRLELSVEDLVFEAAGEVKTFGVTCNGEWKIEGGGEWCVTDTDAGEGDRTVSVTVVAYDGLEDRNVNLTVKAGDKAVVLGVTQKRKDAVVLSKDKLDVPQDGGTLSVEVQSNIDYEVSIPEEFRSWISQVPDSRAVETRTYRFAIEGNEETESRRGYIVFAAAAMKDTVYVYQAQKDRLLLEQDSYDVPAEGETVTVELKTNVDYEVVMPEGADWLSRVETRALRTDRLTFTVAANEESESRSAKVVIKDVNNRLDDTLYIRQFGEAVLLIDKTSIDVSADGGTVSVEVRSNVDYEVTISQYWIWRVLETRAMTTKVFNFEVWENIGYEPRTGYIVFKSDVSEDTVFIRQAESGGLQLVKDRVTLRAESQDVTVEVRTNVDYRVEIPSDAASWVSWVQTRALETESLLFHIEENTGDARSARIAIESVDGKLTRLFDITQQGAELAPGDEQDITADFDSEFAKALQDRGYVPDADRIILGDVKYIDKLVISGKALVSLQGIEHFESLTYLDCSNDAWGNAQNSLTSLDVSKNTLLTQLYCSNNNLTALNVSNNRVLISLDCSNDVWRNGQNSLTSLDVSKNTLLTEFNCSNNKLVSLDISNNKALTRLYCSNNRLSALDVINNKALSFIDCTGNPGQDGVFELTVLRRENNSLTVCCEEWDYEGQKVVLRKVGDGNALGEIYTETVSGAKFEMVYVKGGTFIMGATEEQGADYDGDEKPVHQVTLSDYYIGKYEVTQGLWEKVMGTTLEEQRDKGNKDWPLYGQGSDYPMYYINWEEAQAFVEKLSELTGRHYVLPTEAQWEYAARGGVKSKGYKYSGSNTLSDVAWYRENSEEKKSASPVGSKSPNELGIYDMSGNVYECCSDWYGSYNNESQIDPTGPVNGAVRVYRGGSWDGNYCRVSYRLDCCFPGDRDIDLGLRVALLP